MSAIGKFLAALFDAEDRAADSIIVGGIIGTTALIVFEGLDVFWKGAAFEPTKFAEGIALILGAIGGAKMLRDNVQIGGSPPKSG